MRSTVLPRYFPFPNFIMHRRTWNQPHLTFSFITNYSCFNIGINVFFSLHTHNFLFERISKFVWLIWLYFEIEFGYDTLLLYLYIFVECKLHNLTVYSLLCPLPATRNLRMQLCLKVCSELVLWLPPPPIKWFHNHFVALFPNAELEKKATVSWKSLKSK